jgi:hypothetical protein
MLIYEIIVTPYYVIYYNIMVNIPICYSNSTIVNIYWHCRKLVYKIIVNRGGYKITYFIATIEYTLPIYSDVRVYAPSEGRRRGANVPNGRHLIGSYRTR